VVYPVNFESKIGFNVIRELLQKYCLSSLGHEEVLRMSFSDDYESIKFACGTTDEMSVVLPLNSGFPQSGYYNLLPELSRIETPGTFFEPETLIEFYVSLKTIKEILVFLRSKPAAKFHLLRQLSTDIESPDIVISRIETIIDEKGEIKDSASDVLATIRKKLKSLSGKADRKLFQILRQSRIEGLIPDDFEPTVRNGRMVLPVPATNKRKIKGFIHDESATGQTVYLEPAEVFEINNEIRDLENDERKEIIKILTEFADFLRPHNNMLSDAYRFLGKIDFIRAKALLALKIDAVIPEIINKPVINWEQARHPLLVLSHKEQKRIVVPADIKLDEFNRILVISGPNAGGKSVCMKTAGINQYMLQCGMLIPVGRDSTSGMFSQIFLEIGDDQSLENDLSTYSSHLLNISFFLKEADSSTLFLIDEFGAGTEPQLGGAIAEATLTELSRSGAYGIVTTHYTNIKMLADKLNGVFNGAMLFDTEKMIPLYILKTGRPGSSFAFEIASKIGFPADVLAAAEAVSATGHLDFDRHLNEIEVQKDELAKQKQELDIADQFLNEIVQKYNKLNSDLLSSKERMLADARLEALAILNNANSLVENTIREIKETNAEVAVAKNARTSIDKEKERLKSINPVVNVGLPKYGEGKLKIKGNKPLIKTLNRPPVIGDYVKLEGQDWLGELIEIKGKMGVVTSGVIKIRVPLSNMLTVDVKNSDIPVSSGRSNKSITDAINRKAELFKMQLDLRGMRTSEALDILRLYIDEAVLLRVPEVHILHGKGDGVLRRVVRDYLSGVAEVNNMNDQILELGGSGITVVKF